VESSVTGFGAIIVGGVEFDDGAASVVDDDGTALVRNGNEVRLGMTVQVGGAVAATAGAQPVARTFHIATAVVGPVDAVDNGTRTLSVLGQQIEVSGSAVFGAPLHGAILSLRVGDVVAVHAHVDGSSARYVGTRLETAPNAHAYRPRGVASALDTAARTFRLGGATVSYALASNVPPTLANGQNVNLHLAPRGTGTAYSVDAFGETINPPNDADSALVDGLVSSAANAGSFSVNGMPVDASHATQVPSQALVATGTFVSVQGRIAAGTLLASQVTVMPTSVIDARVFRVSGGVSGLDTTAKTFTVRNVAVDYSGAAFVNGTAAGLGNGGAVSVEGTLAVDGVADPRDPGDLAVRSGSGVRCALLPCHPLSNVWAS
jgi:hypothetical protein